MSYMSRFFLIYLFSLEIEAADYTVHFPLFCGFIIPLHYLNVFNTQRGHATTK